MTASLRVKHGYYHMIFTYKNDAGEWKQKSESTGLKERGNKRKAEAMMKERQAELEAQGTKQLETSSKVLFLDAMDQWLKDVMVSQVRENTLAEYERLFEYHIRSYKGFQGLLLCDLTPQILQTYYNTKVKSNLSPNSILKQHANISKFLKYALSMEMISRNPAERVTLPKKDSSNKAKFYNAEQLKELFLLFKGDPLESVVLLSASLGLRRSEVCGLRWEAIDFNSGKIYICHTAIVVNGKTQYLDNTKSKSSNRVLPLSKAVQDHLAWVRLEQRRMQRLMGNTYINSGYVCTKPDGSPINPDFVTHHFLRVMKSSGLPPVRFHDLRHSAASLLHSCGYDLKDIQIWLGHSDIQTTGNIYTHLEENRLTNMAEMMGQALSKD